MRPENIARVLRKFANDLEKQMEGFHRAAHTYDSVKGALGIDDTLTLVEILEAHSLAISALDTLSDGLEEEGPFFFA